MAAFAATCRRHHDLANPILYKINIDRDLSTAMLWAARYGRIDTMELMFKFGAEVNDTAASIDFGGFIPSWIIGDPVVHNSNFVFPLPREDRGYCMFAPLALAAAYGQDVAVSWLLDHGARLGAPAQNLCGCHCIIPDSDGYVDGDPYHPGLSPLWKPLHLAVCNGHISTTKLLIARGADPKNVGQGSHSGGYYGPFYTTALHAAAEAPINGGMLVDYLVTKQNIPVDVPDPLWASALHYACLNFKDQSALERLVELGADLEAAVDIVFKDETPLALAIHRGNFKAALELLGKGANHDIIIKRHRDTTLLDVATGPLSSFSPISMVMELTTWEGEQMALIQKLRELDWGRGVTVKRT